MPWKIHESSLDMVAREYAEFCSLLGDTGLC